MIEEILRGITLTIGAVAFVIGLYLFIFLGDDDGL